MRGELSWNVVLWQLLPGGRIGEQFCGGTLLGDEWVLTTANCANRASRPGEILISPQSYQPNHMESETKLLGVDSVSYHFFYGTALDIALLHIEQRTDGAKIQFPANPLCLPPPDVHFVGALCVITGWEIWSDVIQTRALRLLPQKVLAPEVCAQLIGEQAVREGVICAGHPASKRAACMGDLGGPLQCTFDHQQWLLAGIVFHDECYRTNQLPLLVAGIQSLIPWILSVTGAELRGPVARSLKLDDSASARLNATKQAS